MPRTSRAASFRPSVEFLERRCVPATITPTTFADGGLGSGSLRDAVLQFNADTGTDDDIIQLSAGTYTLTIRNAGGHHETAGLTGDLNLTQTSHRWVIQGAGPSTIIDASQLQDRAFQIVNPGTQVVFRDLVIERGLAQDDGSDGAEAGTTDALGGGILNNAGNITLDNVVVQNNVARGGDATNAAPGQNASGGGLYSTGGALTIAGATISNNQSIGGRGGHSSGYRAGDGGSATGGGLYASGGSLDIANSTLANNQAVGGQGGDGGPYTGIFTGPPLGGNGGSAQGGGLFVNGGSLTIARSTIASNYAVGNEPGLYGLSNGLSSGGGLSNSGRLTVTDSTLSGNFAYSRNSYANGGGIWNQGTLTINNSTLAGNSAGARNCDGGGIYNRGTLTVNNSTLSGNSAQFDGGGIYTYPSEVVTLSNVTLTANRANRGGGLASAGSLLHNTLIAGNFHGATGTTPDDVYGLLDQSGDYNLIGDGTGMTGLSHGVNGNQVGSASDPIDPLLGPLQDNGGPTKTHSLLAGSPALNVGDPSQLGVADQRGVIRSGGVNIGANQASASTFVLIAPEAIQAGVPFSLSVTAVDQFGQVAFGYTGTVHFGGADGQATLPSNYPFTLDDGGVHVFSNGVTLKTAGNQSVTATDTATASTTGSASVAVNSAAADHLLFLRQPTDTPAGQMISPIVVEVVDQYGNVETDDYSDTITLSLGSNPSGGTLSGTLTLTVVNGVATFTDLAIDLAGDRYTLHATTTELTDAESVAFRITA
jgi:hypothetical protein